MKRFLPLLLLVAACGQPAETPDAASDSTAVEAAATPAEAVPTFRELMLEARELVQCKENQLNEPGMLPDGPNVNTSSYVTIIEIPCGPAPGTGAYGYPLALVAEWPAAENTPEGNLPRVRQAILFHEKVAEGAFAASGYVTQAIPFWSELDLEKGELHLLYKYAGAGQCGMLTTYSSEAWRSPFQFREARELSCDDAYQGDGSDYDPRKWEVVYSAWEEGF
ncbi:MAG: hypothetical protein O3C45_11285 [Bacteroidetes bacterium]|nr:hypothetical protein [Bacteroidota bacterium]MDA0875626.1 hypothetical protein [Bacteroidota bacterium]